MNFRLSILISSLVILVQARADDWPYDPICRNHNAISVTVKMTRPSTRTVILCRFGEGSYIEKETLFAATTSLLQPNAVREYVHNESDDFNNSKGCSQLGAAIFPATDANNQQYRLCVFGDNSIMEEETFSHGVGDASNWQLDEALGL